ncbi:MAG TPA: CHAT domain-containing protein [Thermoanaerobaculia bacterium]|jgi:CHAT domain-containing protein/tetratricopeptide (TPR) repeat protein|nr:CHAT domain-containing protein [Thermoanaerobaculia bacterium]
MAFMMLVPRKVALSFILLVLVAASPPVEAFPSAAVVESVTPHSAASVAGLLPGDVILSWSSATSRGDVGSPLDLLPVEIEEAPRHPVTLRGRRGDEERTWVLATGEWGMETRPALEAAAGDGRLAAWFLDRKARELSEARKWPEADAAYAEAVEALKREAGPAAAAETLRAWGASFQSRSDWDAAIERFRQALALDRETAPKSLSTARTLLVLGQVTAKKGDFEGAEAFLQQGLAISEELAPGSLDLAAAFNKLGVLARWRGDLEAAEEYLTRAEEIRRRLAPGSIGQGLTLTNLGNVVFDAGDLTRSESLHRQALALFEAIEPDGGAVVGCLQNLANVLLLRGDLAGADELLRRMLDIQERRGASDWEAWSTLTSLGRLAMERGDLEAAEVYYRRALAIQERKPSPEGRDIALSLGSLGEVALQRGDFTVARDYLRRAQDIEEKLDPGSLTSAEGLEALARLEVRSGGDLAAAEDLLRRALAIFEQQAPESVQISIVLRDLGEVVGRRGRLQEGLDLSRRALDLQSRLAPGGNEEVATLYSLGRAERQAGRNEEGIHDLCRAVDVLDHQRIRLGGTLEERTSFEATLGQYYQACLEGRIELGQPAEAFHVLERGRARSFLALLAERDIHLSDLPPELAAERRRVNAEYDRVQSELAPLKAGRDDADIADIERLTGELSDLRVRQEEISARIRREAPRSAALQDPEPLDLEGARAALDPGTAFLEYAVGEEKSWVFVVEPSGLAVFPVAAGAKALRKEVEAFRLLLRDPASDQAKIRTTARRLYDLLIRPAEARVSGAQRLLVSPDGPLHTLAFAALRRGDRYLVEWKPIHQVLSATVYAELVRSRRPAGSPGGESLAAFGDPVYRSKTPATPAGVHGAGRPGLALVRLPFSGREVKAIAGLFPQARIYLGADATEERVKSLGPETRLVHFACHGVLDERFPLNSALALSVPGQKSEGRDNGLLQAWEIFESVRLDADLVTLSACDTALGREMGGEGLIGLTRAFQYAGARSVLASLWSIADSSTARFMQSFYGNLRKGMSKDEALRAAQIEHIKGTHPFHWAAFQLTGDWR